MKITVHISESFRWFVPSKLEIRTVAIPEMRRTGDGYEMVAHSGPLAVNEVWRHGERYLVPAPGATVRREDIKEDVFTALFMNFAHLDCTEEDVLRFASRFGQLTNPNPPERIEQRDEQFTDAELERHWRVTRGESLELWYGEIQRLRAAVELWTASKADILDHDLVREALEADQPAVLELLGRWHGGIRWDDDLSAVVIGQKHALMKASDFGKAISDNARAIAHYIVTDHCNRTIGGNLTWGFTQTAPYVPVLTPSTLLTALWLQLLVAMSKDAQYGTCEYCGQFFDATGARRDRTTGELIRKYCPHSESCKSKAYLKRQAAQKSGS